MRRDRGEVSTKKYVYVMVVACLLLIGVVIWGAVDRAKEPAENVSGGSAAMEAVSATQVMIEVKDDADVRNCVGSGVVYKVTEDGVWIASSKHVLEDRKVGEHVCVRIGDVEIRCKQWVPAKETDLAFIYIPGQDIPANAVFEAATSDKATYDALTSGETVTAKGYHAGTLAEYVGELTESWIYVEDFAEYMMLARCEIYQGMSGGGLYDSTGNFIGMICGGNEEGELVAVPWHVMQARFEETCETE